MSQFLFFFDDFFDWTGGAFIHLLFKFSKDRPALGDRKFHLTISPALLQGEVFGISFTPPYQRGNFYLPLFAACGQVVFFRAASKRRFLC
ncbi:hypothetical protein [Desulforamulus hydrothermalis]|uniref:hypothetical protein n=1 Tax=Desulforamulus hydrothermalis TaxID=412895 RepID=UPI000662402D|nr:hypothetical protein [Desulforamulus hydrothermalis]